MAHITVLEHTSYFLHLDTSVYIQLFASACGAIFFFACAISRTIFHRIVNKILSNLEI